MNSLNEKCRLSAPPFSRQQTSCVIDAYKERAALYRSQLRGAALAESRMAPEELAQIQQALIDLGFFNGEADGEFGPMTRAGIRKFQEANGFLRSDFLSMEQKRALLEGRLPTADAGRLGQSAPSVAGTPPQSIPQQQPMQRPEAPTAQTPASPMPAQPPGQAGQDSVRAESSGAKPGPTRPPEPPRPDAKPESAEQTLQRVKNRVIVANDFGCREEQTFERLRDLRISDKEAFRRMITREVASGRCTIFEIGDPVRVDSENTGWGLDPWSCVNRPGEIDRCYWTSARILNCVLICNDEEQRLAQRAFEVQQKRRP